MTPRDLLLTMTEPPALPAPQRGWFMHLYRAYGS